MAALPAAQIEDSIIGLECGGPNQRVDFASRIAVILDDVAIGLEIDRVEQRPPPIGRQVPFQIGYRAHGAGGSEFSRCLFGFWGSVGRSVFLKIRTHGTCWHSLDL